MAAERLAAADGLPEVRLVSGPLDRLPPASAVLAWGETEAVQRDRERAREPGSEARAGPVAVPSPRPASLAETLWMIAASDPRAAARANHRSLALGLSRSLGVELPGAEIIRSIAELERHLQAGGRPHLPAGGGYSEEELGGRFARFGASVSHCDPVEVECADFYLR